MPVFCLLVITYSFFKGLAMGLITIYGRKGGGGEVGDVG